MVDVRANLEIFLAVAVLGFALLQGVVAALSYHRLRNRRPLLIALGFFAFAAKGAYLTAVAWQTRGTEDWVLIVGLLDLSILLFLYLAIRGR